MQTDILTIIKESFEQWYNSAFSSHVSIVINYSDTQPFSMKAIHKVTIELHAVSIKDGHSFTQPLISLSENYNHGVLSEQEEKEKMTKRLLTELYSYSSKK